MLVSGNSDLKKDDVRSIARQTVGVFFYGTPHNGAALATYFSKLMILPGAQSDLIANLQHDGPSLLDLTMDFSQLQKILEFQVLSFVEVQPMKRSLFSIGKVKIALILIEDSAPHC